MKILRMSVMCLTLVAACHDDPTGPRRRFDRGDIRLTITRPTGGPINDPVYRVARTQMLAQLATLKAQRMAYLQAHPRELPWRVMDPVHHTWVYRPACVIAGDYAFGPRSECALQYAAVVASSWAAAQFIDAFMWLKDDVPNEAPIDTPVILGAGAIAIAWNISYMALAMCIENQKKWAFAPVATGRFA